MNSDKLKNNLDEQKICDLIGSLEKVSAPKDFDFRLKARISAAKENNFQPSIWRTLRYALPLTATAIIAAFVMIQAGIFSSNQSPIDNNLADADQSQPQNVNQTLPPSNIEIGQTSNSKTVENSNKTFVPNTLIAESNSEKDLKVKNFDKKSSKNLSKPEDDDFKGYNDTALKQSNVDIPPAGISKKNTPVNKEFNQNSSLTTQEIFDLIGLETETDGDKLKVKSVKKNSLADRSGMKNGDVIEAIDDKKFDQNNSVRKLEGAKTITVIRDNKIQKIELKP